MAHPALKRPLPDSGRHGPEESDWMHDLTPTVSDDSMFAENGPVRPLQVWPTEPVADRPRPKLRLVRPDEDEVESDKPDTTRTTGR